MKNRYKIAIACIIGTTVLQAEADSRVFRMEVDAGLLGASVSQTMYGIFFEDINFGADGGLYAELIKNRSFEFDHPFVGWTPFGGVTIETADPCFPENPHYVRIVNNGQVTRSGLDNGGFRGIGLKKDAVYRFSVYGRTPGKKPVRMRVELVDGHEVNVTGAELEISGDTWKKSTIELKSPVTDARGRLRLILLSPGTVDLDHVSLFPADTWKRRENGWRKDLVQALYDLNPGVLRFPGGCIVEGTTLANRYQWKKTVGPVETRPVNLNRWNYTFYHKFMPDYYQSCGLGFYEYFLLSEDLGAEPLPILNCGLACQYQSGECVPLDSLQPYVQDALDLIEFANGPVDSPWGKVRAEMGHPEPFGLKYLGIGNEQWGSVYPERLEIFANAIRMRYPGIRLIGSSGPSPDGKEFDYLWREMERLGVDLVDEHYYCEPDWFFAHADRYDTYDRKGPKVFAGEYASHDRTHEKKNNFRAALSEAAFMTGLERNADVVRMATYAPLFAHTDAWQWNPDLIWFDNLSLVRTPSYYVQQLFGMNSGTHVVSVKMEGRPVTGQDGIYASAVWDEPVSQLIVKVVNREAEDKDIRLHIQGLKKEKATEGTCFFLHSDDPDDSPVANEPERILPRMRPLAVDRRSSEILLFAEGYSVNVYRITIN